MPSPAAASQCRTQRERADKTKCFAAIMERSEENVFKSLDVATNVRNKTEAGREKQEEEEDGSNVTEAELGY
ncbi:uncharacterized protein V6R79_023642 [Siganus canaliculatus]